MKEVKGNGASGELLTAEQEADLARRVAAGDTTARDEFINRNQGLVKMIAYRYVNSCSGLELEDLTQAGNIGLIHAVDKFDPSMGYKFSTYATWWVRQAITREIIDRDAALRLPVHVYEKLRRIRRASADIEQRTGKPATDAEVAAALGESEDNVEAFREMSYIGNAVRIDAPIGDDGDATLGDMLPSSDDDPSVLHDAVSLRAEIEFALEKLDPREQAVIKMRFGLDDGQERTLDAVGAKYNVTRERVRQIIDRALKKLRSPRIAKLLLSVYMDN
ncbi:MAG: sigma-70 family RNA polymerase sigma factor [Clostridia bacterium]|nr:sigma-70 family RNA polymerase sigma factor [Clostridia bacterium]